MYLEFYGFVDKPFEVTPDPKFLYMTPGYQEILSALIYGIHERRGFIAIVGEVGTGKTLMLNALLDRLDHKHKAALIFNSDLTFKQMLLMVLCDLGIAEPEERMSKADAIQRLNEFAIKQLEKDGNVVIIVDEAQNISDRTMENIRMLSNLETRKHKLVQIVLCGQPELDEKLSRYGWRQLVQRISLKRYATTLSEEDTYRYLQHRLETAGYKGTSLFTQEAQKLIREFSGGIPRKINILCDNALLIGYGLARKEIDEEIISEAISDLSWSPYLDGVEPIDSVPLESQTANTGEEQVVQAIKPQPVMVEKKREAILTGTHDADSQTEQDSTDHEMQIEDSEKVSSMLDEEEHSDAGEKRKGFLKLIFNRRQSGLIAGVLILVGLILMAWLFITKPKLNLGINISQYKQNVVQTDAMYKFDRKRRLTKMVN
jgi:type II secretory pathway predicted ATPase ExeA